MPLANQPEDMGSLLAEIERRLRILEATSPLTSASIQNGALRVLDSSLAERLRFGKLLDNSYGLNIVDGAITVGGGPVRAMDIAYGTSEVTNAALTTTLTAVTTATLTVPAWANTAVVFGWIIFQMSNSSGGVQGQKYRVDIDGWPGTGQWQSDVPNGGIMVVGDTQSRTLTRGVDLGASIPVSAVCGVTSGTNNANIIRIRSLAFFLR